MRAMMQWVVLAGIGLCAGSGCVQGDDATFTGQILGNEFAASQGRLTDSGISIYGYSAFDPGEISDCQRPVHHHRVALGLCFEDSISDATYDIQGSCGLPGGFARFSGVMWSEWASGLPSTTLDATGIVSISDDQTIAHVEVSGVGVGRSTVSGYVELVDCR